MTRLTNAFSKKWENLKSKSTGKLSSCPVYSKEAKRALIASVFQGLPPLWAGTSKFFSFLPRAAAERPENNF